MNSLKGGAGTTPDPIPNWLVRPGSADDASGTGFWPVVHRLEACATKGK